MNNQEQNNNEQYVSVSLEYGPGQTLADGREARGMTIADVASHLNVTENIVNGLERDDYNNLPPAIYTRGYLRNYANLLDIDPEPLLERQKQLTSIGDEDEAVTRPAAIHAETSGRMIDKSQFRRKKDRSINLFIILLLIMIVGIGYGIFTFMTKDPSYPSSSASGQNSDQNEAIDTSGPDVKDAISIPQGTGAQELSIPIEDNADSDAEQEQLQKPQTLSLALPDQLSEEVERQIDSSLIDQEQNQQQVQIEAITPVQFDESSAEQEVVIEQESQVESAVSEQRTTDISDLKLFVAHDSYIEITDATGKRFLFRVLPGGTIKEISGKRPFKVVLGNAGAVKLEYNGEPYDFGDYSLGKVARFSLQ